MSTSSHHSATDANRRAYWTMRLELFVSHLFLALLVAGLLPEGVRERRNIEGKLDAVESWLLCFIRGGNPTQRDTLPEGDIAAFRLELDRQTEAASLASEQATAYKTQLDELHAFVARVHISLAELHNVGRDELSIPALVLRTVELVATVDRARQIKAERERDEYRAELNKVTRELATSRDALDMYKRSRANEETIFVEFRRRVKAACDRVSAPGDDDDPSLPTPAERVDWMAFHIEECESIINGCRAAFGKKPMGAEGEEYMDLVADVTAAVQACNRGGSAALVPLPKPGMVASGQRWARLFDVARVVGVQEAPQEEGGASLASGEFMRNSDKWIYLGPAKEG